MESLLAIFVLFIISVYFIFIWIDNKINQRKESHLDKKLQVYDPLIEDLLEESFERDTNKKIDYSRNKESGIFTNSKIDNKTIAIVLAGIMAIMIINKRTR